MNNIQEILTQNMIKLRRDRQLTQIELGEKINYSDKTISKWEKGDSCPNIEAVYRIAQYYGVSVDDLLSDGFEPSALPEDEANTAAPKQQHRYSKMVISLLSVVSVWTIATITFIFFILRKVPGAWLAFIDVIPVSFIVLLVFNTLWGKHKLNYVIITFLIWTLLTAVYLHLLFYNLWGLYLLGIPIQISVILWSQLKK